MKDHLKILSYDVCHAPPVCRITGVDAVSPFIHAVSMLYGITVTLTGKLYNLTGSFQTVFSLIG